MKPFSLMPLAGIDNTSDDEDLQVGGQAPRLYLREALNVTISESGRLRMRPGRRKVSDTPLTSVWQSPLHRDVFGLLGDQWVKVETATWSTQALATIGAGPLSHVVLNSQVLAAGPEGIYAYDGHAARRFTLGVPPPPMVTPGTGALEPGAYGVAVAWLRGAMESPLSPMVHCTVEAGGGLSILLPQCPDPSVTSARLYFTGQNGGALGRGEDYPIALQALEAPLLPKMGAAPQFQHMEPMPTGDYLGYWRGRLVVARGSVLRFSEAMAYHVHDPLHGFVQMPQRITFLHPVDGGLWVGQVDHVAFLAGTSPGELAMARKTAKAPVPGSAVALDAETAGEISSGGASTVAWLAANGYVLGSPSGAVVETQAGRLCGITGNRATSIVFGKRLLTAVT
jgi:hypothetical protein